jgi:hypothetical protein
LSWYWAVHVAGNRKYITCNNLLGGGDYLVTGRCKAHCNVQKGAFINMVMNLVYGTEAWVLSKADELRLGVFERKILRIYGPICEEAIWRSRYNEELYRLFDETDLVTTIRITRLRWAGHIVRMQDTLPWTSRRTEGE